jgi:hypothetical protein
VPSGLTRDILFGSAFRFKVLGFLRFSWDKEGRKDTQTPQFCYEKKRVRENNTLRISDGSVRRWVGRWGRIRVCIGWGGPFRGHVCNTEKTGRREEF